MNLENLTYRQALKIVGKANMQAVREEDCEFATHIRDDGMVDFEATIGIDHEEYDHLTAHYTQTEEDVENNDLSDLDWKITHYSIY